MSTSKPSFLFITGSWHVPKHFDPIRMSLESRGFSTYCPMLRTSGAGPPLGPADDADLIQGELTRLIEIEGRDVLVVCHSYGGVVASEAAEAAFSKKARQKEGQKGGILRIVFVAAFVMPIGESLMSAYGDIELSGFSVDDQGIMTVEEPASKFYHDLPKKEQDRWVSELKGQPILCPTTPLTRAGYLHHPMSFFFCEQDRAFPIEAQRAMIKSRMLENQALDVHTETLDSSHSPFLSQTEKVAGLLTKLIT